MDATCNAKDLRRALSVALAALNKRASIPVLTHIRVTADGGGTLAVEGTDLRTSARAELPATVARQGTCLVPFEALRALKGKGDVRISTGTGLLVHVEAEGQTQDVRTLQAEDYPALAFGAPCGSARVGLAAAQWLDLLDTVEHAVGAGDPRPWTGLCLEGDGSDLVATTTDGHRLAQARVPHTFPFPETLVPADALPALRALCTRVVADRDTTEQGVTLHVPPLPSGSGAEPGPRDLRVTNCRNDLAVRPVDARFPPWRQVVPAAEPDDAIVAVDAAELGAALRGLIPHAKGHAKGREGGIVVHTEDGALVIVSTNPDRGTASARVPCKGGAMPRLGLNPRYLAEACAAVGGKGRLVLRHGGELAPIVLRPETDDGALAVVMPMRI